MACANLWPGWPSCSGLQFLIFVTYQLCTASSSSSQRNWWCSRITSMSLLSRDLNQYKVMKNVVSNILTHWGINKQPNATRKCEQKNLSFKVLIQIIMMAKPRALIQVCSTHICMVQCTHLITTGGTPHLYNIGSSMLVNSLHSGENNM